MSFGKRLLLCVELTFSLSGGVSDDDFGATAGFDFSGRPVKSEHTHSCMGPAGQLNQPWSNHRQSAAHLPTTSFLSLDQSAPGKTALRAARAAGSLMSTAARGSGGGAGDGVGGGSGALFGLCTAASHHTPGVSVCWV